MDWSVRSMEDEPYPVYMVWTGNRLLGVAGGKDGLAELFIDIIRDYEADKHSSRKFDILGVRRSRGEVKTRRFVGSLTKDDAPEADENPDIGKGWGTATRHHIVVEVAPKPKPKPEKGGKEDE